MNTKINNNTSSLSSRVSSEESVRESVDSSLNTKINNNTSSLSSRVSSEESARESVDSSLNTKINNNTSSLSSRVSSEESTRESVDSSLNTKINNNTSSLSSRVSSEESARESVDSSLQSRVSTEESIRTSTDSSLNTKINNNTSSLSSRVSSEESTRESSDSSLNTKINNNTSSLSSRVSTEESNRTYANTLLQSQINTLKYYTNEKILVSDLRDPNSIPDMSYGLYTLGNLNGESNTPEIDYTNVSYKYSANPFYNTNTISWESLDNKNITFRGKKEDGTKLQVNLDGITANNPGNFMGIIDEIGSNSIYGTEITPIGYTSSFDTSGDDSKALHILIPGLSTIDLTTSLGITREAFKGLAYTQTTEIGAGANVNLPASLLSIIGRLKVLGNDTTLTVTDVNSSTTFENIDANNQNLTINVKVASGQTVPNYNLTTNAGNVSEILHITGGVSGLTEDLISYSSFTGTGDITIIDSTDTDLSATDLSDVKTKVYDASNTNNVTIQNAVVITGSKSDLGIALDTTNVTTSVYLSANNTRVQPNEVCNVDEAIIINNYQSEIKLDLSVLGLSDSLSEFASSGSITTDFGTILSDDSDVNITITDTSATLDASSLAAIRDSSDTTNNKTRGTMQITGDSIIITGNYEDLEVCLISDNTKEVFLWQIL